MRKIEHRNLYFSSNRSASLEADGQRKRVAQKVAEVLAQLKAAALSDLEVKLGQEWHLVTGVDEETGQLILSQPIIRQRYQKRAGEVERKYSIFAFVTPELVQSSFRKKRPGKKR